MTREEALIELLALPDEPCLCGLRVHRLTQPGHPETDVIKLRLALAYVTHRWQDFGQDISCAKVVRLKIVRRA
jgi:hypothetical protein